MDKVNCKKHGTCAAVNLFCNEGAIGIYCAHCVNELLGKFLHNHIDDKPKGPAVVIQFVKAR